MALIIKNTHFGPKIVTDGLLLYLDARNPRSYSGSSATTWSDLSGNGNNATLDPPSGGPTFNSANGGSIVFDGDNDRASVPYNSAFNLVTSTTINIWYFAAAVGGWIMNRDKNAWQGYNIGPGNIVYSGEEGSNDFERNFTPSLNTWNMLTWVVNRQSGVYLLYLNSVQEGAPDDITHPALTSTTPLYLGYRGVVDDNFFNGRISNVLIYNRALTASEITQNFNIFRGRFGI